MAATEQTHLLLPPGLRIEQTRRRLVKLRGEGLIARVTLPQAGWTRVRTNVRYEESAAPALPTGNNPAEHGPQQDPANAKPIRPEAVPSRAAPGRHCGW
ncbi:hypothetical protein SUDANB176_07384 [Streptomyces sp. enrichment culture]